MSSMSPWLSLSKRQKPLTRSLEQCLRWASGRSRRLVIDRPDLSVAQIHPLHFGEVERAAAEAAEDGELVAAFVDRAVAVEAFGDRERGAGGLVRRDEPGLRAR